MICKWGESYCERVLFFNLHHRVIFFPQCQVFTLHVLEYLFHLLKCYVSQMAFCDYYLFFNSNFVCFMSSKKGTVERLLSIVMRWVPNSQPFLLFPQELFLWIIPRIHKKTNV